MLQEQINKDYIEAMKARDTAKSATLNFLRAQLKNVIIEKKVEQLDDQDVITVLKKQIKQRQDSIEQFEQGGRKELADKEKGELEVLMGYLPEQLSEEAIAQIIKDCIDELQANSMKDMGRVMKAVGDKTQGNADNKIVSQLVKQALSAS